MVRTCTERSNWSWKERKSWVPIKKNTATSMQFLWPTGPLQMGCVRSRASHRRRGRRCAASFMSDVLTQKRVCEQESAACERANWIESCAQFSYPWWCKLGRKSLAPKVAAFPFGRVPAALWSFSYVAHHVVSGCLPKRRNVICIKFIFQLRWKRLLKSQVPATRSKDLKRQK